MVRLEGGPQAGADLYLPPAVGLFITAAFFTGFLSKAGEDAYEAVKAGTKLLWRKASTLKLRYAGTAGKVRENGYSIAFAVGCELMPGLRAKLLIPTDGSPGDIEVGIACFLELVRRIHAGIATRQELEALLHFRAVGGTLLWAYDPVAKTIVAVDGRDPDRPADKP